MHHLTGLSLPVKYFTYRSKAVLLLWIFYVFSVLCLLCLCARLFICALWSPAGKGLTSWLSFVVSICEFITFSIGILGQVWYLIVSVPDLCTLTYCNCQNNILNQRVFSDIMIDNIKMCSTEGRKILTAEF